MLVTLMMASWTPVTLKTLLTCMSTPSITTSFTLVSSMMTICMHVMLLLAQLAQLPVLVLVLAGASASGITGAADPTPSAGPTDTV